MNGLAVITKEIIDIASRAFISRVTMAWADFKNTSRFSRHIRDMVKHSSMPATDHPLAEGVGRVIEIT